MANSHITQEARVSLVTFRATLMLLSCLAMHASVTLVARSPFLNYSSKASGLSIRNSPAGGQEIKSYNWYCVGGKARVFKEINSQDSR